MRRKKMTSKWINKKYFDEYTKNKENENTGTSDDFDRLNRMWRTPVKGTVESPKVYEGRFLPDPKGKFTLRFFYHLFNSGDQWRFVLCTKTFDFQNWCPFCAATSKLYKGSDADKKQAYNYKRKSKHVGNFYIVDDPRDAEVQDVSRKVDGTVKIYEFPDSVESKLRQEIIDKKRGLGEAIFDPGDGYNFVLKVKSTKPNANNDVFPDYSDSTFARSSDSLGNDSEIKKIIESTHDLEKHIREREEGDNEIKELLKGEMLWEIIEDEWERNKPKSKATGAIQSEDNIPDFKSPKKNEDDEKKEPEAEKELEVEKEPEAEESESGIDDDDAELLRELEDL